MYRCISDLVRRSCLLLVPCRLTIRWKCDEWFDRGAYDEAAWARRGDPCGRPLEIVPARAGGYLTIVDERQRGERSFYELGYPNREVEPGIGPEENAPCGRR